MADNPTWWLAIDAATKLVTTGGLILGGAVGYNRYLRGRVPHAKCDLELQAKVVSVDGGQALEVQVIVKNAGQCRLLFNLDPPMNRVL
jgi:hypothetical protein